MQTKFHSHAHMSSSLMLNSSLTAIVAPSSQRIASHPRSNRLKASVRAPPFPSFSFLPHLISRSTLSNVKFNTNTCISRGSVKLREQQHSPALCRRSLSHPSAVLSSARTADSPTIPHEQLTTPQVSAPAVPAKSPSSLIASLLAAVAMTVAYLLAPGRAISATNVGARNSSSKLDTSMSSSAHKVVTVAWRRPRLRSTPSVSSGSSGAPQQGKTGTSPVSTAKESKLALLVSRAVAVRDSLLEGNSNAQNAEHADNGHASHSAAVSDALVLLGTTVLIVPLMRRLKTSPILGFLAAGILLGPNGLALVRDVGTSKALAELGVVFFLFEMGLELSTSKLKSLGGDVFGLGTAQFVVTGALIGAVSLFAGLPAHTAIVVGAGLALSSSAFVLQLLAERGDVGTRYGRAAFGILLFQDLVVVPIMVLTPLLAGSGGANAVLKAISVASVKAALALSLIVFLGKTVLQPVFRFVAKAQSPEAFIATILFTALGTSALTSTLGLSDTLGAFLAGVMLAETTFRHQVEADIKPFRGLLLGLFFITVGFSIDLQLALANIGAVFSLVIGLLAIKAGVIAALGLSMSLSIGTALRTGLLLAQGGEFAFVIFGLALQVGVLPVRVSQMLLLVVALSMALTPVLDELGRRIAVHLERRRGLIGVRQLNTDTADAKDFVLVAGYGRVGQSVCEMLDSKLVRYVAFDMSPSRVIDARGKGLPVFYGDACRPEVLRSAGVGRARAVVVTLDDEDAALRAVQTIRREFGDDLEVFCRARDAKHQMLLKAAGATAIVPELLEASLLLGGAVLLAYGTPPDEVSALIQDSRRSNLGEIGTNTRSLTEMLGPLASSKKSEEPVDIIRPSAVEPGGQVSRPQTGIFSHDGSPAASANLQGQGEVITASESEASLENIHSVSRDDDIYATKEETDSVETLSEKSAGAGGGEEVSHRAAAS